MPAYRFTYTDGSELKVESPSFIEAVLRAARENDSPPSRVDAYFLGGYVALEDLTGHKSLSHYHTALMGQSEEEVSIDIPEPGKKLPPQEFSIYRVLFPDKEPFVCPVRVYGAHSALLLYGGNDRYEDDVIAVEGYDEKWKRWTSVYTFSMPLKVHEAATAIGKNRREYELSV